MRKCTDRKGVKDLPISPQGLPAVFLEGLAAVCRAGLPAVILSAVFVADWRAVLGKSGCCEEESNQSLSVMPVEPQGQVRLTSGG